MFKFLILDVWGSGTKTKMRENKFPSVEQDAASFEEAAKFVTGEDMVCDPSDMGSKFAKMLMPVSNPDDPGLLVVQLTR